MASPAILVAVTDALGLAIVERLIGAGADVTALVSAAPPTDLQHELERLGARVVAGSARSPGQLLEAGIGTTAAFVLTANDDAENVDAALAARRLRPDLPLIVRLFDETLAAYVRETLPATVLSMSAVAAPVFAEIALRAIAAAPARRRTVRRSAQVRRLLEVDRVLVATGLSTLALIAIATVYFSSALELRWLDALYFVWTTVFTVGYGDITPRHASDLAKIGSMLLMVAGATFVAVLYVLLSGWVVSRRLDMLRGYVPVRGRGHVIIAGAGKVGVRVARLLADPRRRIVVIERDADNRHLSQLRAAGHHVIVADAETDTTLDLAGVDRAATLLALTESDAINLRIALAVHVRCPGLPVVTGLASPELSAHVAARHDGLAASSIAIGSEEFARAVLVACGASTDGTPEARA